MTRCMSCQLLIKQCFIAPWDFRNRIPVAICEDCYYLINNFDISVKEISVMLDIIKPSI